MTASTSEIGRAGTDANFHARRPRPRSWRRDDWVVQPGDFGVDCCTLFSLSTPTATTATPESQGGRAQGFGGGGGAATAQEDEEQQDED